MNTPLPKKARTVSDENRRFNTEWELDFFFIEKEGRCCCLLCNKIITVMKRSNLERHCRSLHSSSLDKYKEHAREAKLESLKRNYRTQTNIFTRIVNESRDVTLTSYKLSHLLASRMRPYTDGEILKQGILLFTENCCPTSTQKATKLQLSNDTVTRRVECISNDLREQLMSESKNFVCYSIALDGTKDIADIEQLAFFIKPDFTITEELLSIRSLHGSTKGAEIFQQTMTVLKDAELDPAKLVGIATDGAPSMLGLGEGLQGHITRWRQAEELKPVVWHHCIVHQENLVAKSLKFKHVTDIVFSTVNWIRANALNHRQFKQFLVDINADYGDVIIFTAVGWLSRSSVIKRFHALLPEIRTFLQEKGEDVPQLNDNQWLQDLAFFVDITGHLAHLKLQLQGKDKMSHELFATFTAFTSKLELWISQLQRGSTLHFPTLAEFSASLFSYTEVLVDLKVEFDHRFKDFKTSIEELHFFFTPFQCNPSDAPAQYQLELIDLQADISLKTAFHGNSLIDFWRRMPQKTFPQLLENAYRQACIFGSTYTCEMVFSKLIRIKSKFRSRLTDSHMTQLLQVASTTMTPRFDSLVDSQKQFQQSH